MKVLQHNLNYCEAAQSVLVQTAREWRVDIAIISDPYEVPDNLTWAVDTTGKAAIWSCQNIPFQGMVDSTQSGYVRAKLRNTYFYSCYAPPSWDAQQFTDFLNRLVRDVKEHSPAVMAGDFNAWALEWGSKKTNARGSGILEATACLDVELLNTGVTPTYERDGRTSIVDLTFVSTCLLRQAREWKVNDILNLSDHRVITWELGKRKTHGEKTITRGWKVKDFDQELFIAALDMRPVEAANAEEEAQEVMKRIANACDATMARKSSTKGHIPVYWWNDDIAAMRRKCISARRAVTRSRAKRRRNKDELQENYKKIRLMFAKGIQDSKKRCAYELREEVESDPWGKPYKIVVKRLKKPETRAPTCPALLGRIVASLFPQQPRLDYQVEGIAGQEIPPVTEEELMRACKRIKNSKAPGLDGIPNIALKGAIKTAPKIFLSMYNRCLREGFFPSKWKQQRLVLLPKGKKPADEPSSYRPLCMLDTAGKILERIIHGRIEAISEKHLSGSQYGFRKGRSTLDAINRVTSIAKAAIAGERWKSGDKKYCLLAALDIKNAFNSARWDRILEAMEKMNIPEYLRKMVVSYFTDRILKYDNEDGPRKYSITGGVPQGSVLGPLLWIILYDGLLRLKLPRPVTPVAFADDIALVIVGKHKEDLKNLFEVSYKKFQNYLEYLGLKLAEHKTEAVLVTGRKTLETIKLQVGGCEITSQPFIRYLGVMIDARLNFQQQVEHVAAKAAVTGRALSRLMPNLGGPKQTRRALLTSVITSIITYGVALWSEALQNKRTLAKINSVYRNSALRVICAFRTVSMAAAEVVAGILPLQELAEERKCIYRRREKMGTDAEKIMEEERKNSVQRWQIAWDRSEKGRWTHRLIPHIEKWLYRKHGQVNHYLTQMLTGHGCFRSYLYKYKYEDTPECPSCGGAVEDAEHVFFTCQRFEGPRKDLEAVVGVAVTPDNIVDLMLSSKEAWEEITAFAMNVMKRLRSEEQKRTKLRTSTA